MKIELALIPLVRNVGTKKIKNAQGKVENGRQEFMWFGNLCLRPPNKDQSSLYEKDEYNKSSLTKPKTRLDGYKKV